MANGEYGDDEWDHCTKREVNNAWFDQYLQSKVVRLKGKRKSDLVKNKILFNI